ncbi:Helix-turn-helix domain-containing protein [Brevibacterium antiquum CNRZ 918]|uniref:Helix-turn-helix domain-containing protein n=2 Tax=Actinomycetota TaxID=201174 RepID=A0A2H1KYP3_9MICO|nr:Helix-turn-helix domain-containing protein [Brevibacterium antiquum CNRZ 918]
MIMGSSERWGWSVITAACGTIGIALGAFWLSFTALADLARRSGIASSQAWVWPLLVDGLIVVATIAVVALDGRAGAWYPWGLLIAGALVSVAANAMHAVVAAEAAVPGLLASVIASVPPLVLLASTHLTVVLIRSAHHHRSSAVDGLEKAERTDAVDPELATVPDRTDGDGDELPLTSSTVADLPRSALPSPTPLEPTAESSPTPTEAVSDDGPTQLPAPSRTSESAGSGRKPEAARLWEAGWSNKAIAARLDVHPSTIGRWRTRQTATTASSEPGEAAEKESTS